MKKGFSLIELMVVVSIIVFLASLSIPYYFNYISKAKQAEVAINLASLHSAQQMYFMEHGTYNPNLKEIGWKPGINFHYTYGFNISNSQEGINYFIGKLKTTKNHLKNTHANNNNFVAAAIADLTGKGNIDVWTIDENRNITHVKDGLAN